MRKTYMVVLTDSEGSELLFESNNRKQCEAYLEAIIIQDGYEATVEIIEK